MKMEEKIERSERNEKKSIACNDIRGVCKVEKAMIYPEVVVRISIIRMKSRYSEKSWDDLWERQRTN